MFKPKIGLGCSFYHEGGTGERRWVIGWRYGIIWEIPAKGFKFGMARIELPVPLWSFNPANGRYTLKPREKVWVPLQDINAPGDTVFHGLSAEALADERRAKKAAEQAKANKKIQKAGRFHR